MIAGYTVSMGDGNNARGGGQFGPALSRNRMSRQSAVISVSYVFTELQHGIFEAWWKHILNDGASWFTQTQAGEGLETNTVRFVGGYAATLQTAGVWNVTGSVVIDDPYRSA
jgi:hypothetical protein